MTEAFFESAQAILSGCDAAMAHTWRDEDRRWRDEDRRWRREDIEWRRSEQEKLEADYGLMDDERRWRLQDIEQRVLDNARFMWDRNVEKNRRVVEERAEQLKEVSNISALIAGFALVAFLEFNFDVKDTPKGLVYGFGFTTAATVGLMVNSMVTCSFMHSSILKTGRRYVSEIEEANFIFKCREFARNFTQRSVPPKPGRSFERHWDEMCEAEWRIALCCFVTAIPLFMLNVVLAGVIQFRQVRGLWITITAIVAIAFLIYVRSCALWVPHLMFRGHDILEATVQLPPAGLPFAWHQVAAGDSSTISQRDQDSSDPLDEFEIDVEDEARDEIEVASSRSSPDPRPRRFQRQIQSFNIPSITRSRMLESPLLSSPSNATPPADNRSWLRALLTDWWFGDEDKRSDV